MHQYNHIRSLQAAGFITPPLTPQGYTTPTGMDPQQQLQQLQQSQQLQQIQQSQQLQQIQQSQAQLYHSEQLVPQVVQPIPQYPQVVQPIPQYPQVIEPSSPVKMLSISAPDSWLTNSPLPQNPEVFHPIVHAMSRSMLERPSYGVRTNSISSEPSSSLPLSASYDSSQLQSHRHYYSSPKQVTLDSHHRRQRLNSGSSCYSSESPDVSDDDDQFNVSQLVMALFSNFEISTSIYKIIFLVNRCMRSTFINIYIFVFFFFFDIASGGQLIANLHK